MAIPERTALDWRHQAACARPGVDPDLFYPDPGQRTKVAHARRICARCPVQAPCLEEALATPWLDGVWAGTTSRDREHIRAQRRRGAA
jgi:WhiB family transcriptional regulator, redox-sensing transcriptional regulator